MRKPTFWLAIAALVVLPLQGAVAPPDNAQVRSELSSYFNKIAENSPTVLGGLAESPDTMKAIQERIRSMSDDEASQLGALMAQAPDWKVAPEALAGAFPPEMLDHIRRVGANHAAHVPNGEEMRDDVLSLVAILKVLPESKLKELGVDRTLVGSLEETFRQMSPMEASMLEQQASRTNPWRAAGSAAVGSLPKALQKGAVALAEHGPITPADINKLESFRGEVMALLRRIDSLPPETRERLKTETVRNQVHQIALAGPDTIFMLRHNLPPEMLESLDHSLDFLERFANMSKEEVEDLEEFRGDLASALDPFDGEGESSSTGASELLSQLGPEHLSLLRERIEQLPEWRTVMPAAYRSMALPGIQARVAAVEGTNADPEAVAALEAFRASTLADIDANGAGSGLPRETVARARRAVETAAPGHLEMVRATMQQLPTQASARTRLGVALLADRIEFGSCFIDLPSPIPDINLDFLCNPIEDLLTSVRDGVVSTVNTIVNGVRSALETTINTVKGALETAINAVSSTVTSIVNSIKSVAEQIWSTLQQIPTLAWNAIKAGLQALLNIEIANGVTVGQLVAQGASTALASMKQLVGLAEGWWNAVAAFTLPAIPCPSAGSQTPFGVVGTSAATQNYGRYKLLIDGIVDMIPDTEVSLTVKIPAQILYIAFDFLGTCLEQASAQAADDLAGSRHDIVMGHFSTLSTFIGNQVFGFTQHANTQTGVTIARVMSESVNVQAKMTEQSSIVRNLVQSTSNSNQQFLADEAASIRALLQSESNDTQADISAFRDVALQVAIERSLQDGALASFQLLEPQGYLGRVRDVVRSAIDAVQATQQGARDALRYFDAGVALLAQGEEKRAFAEFSKAYKELTKE